jgi:hypothetical protein
MKYLILSSFIFLSWWAQSQKISPVLMSSSGGYTKTENTSFHWAIGELAVSNYQNSSIKLNEGFFQGNVYVTLSENTSLLNISVYPNPTIDILYLYDPENQIQLVTFTDLNGRDILNSMVNLYEIGLRELQSGIYILKIRLKTNRIVDYKIVKI